MTTIEPLDLEPIKARLAGATPGQWVWTDQNAVPDDAEDVTDYGGTPYERGGRCGIEDERDEEAVTTALADDDGLEVGWVLAPVQHEDGSVYTLSIENCDAAVIANAPKDIAALVAEVERLRAELENTRAQAQDAARQFDRITQGEHGA